MGTEQESKACKDADDTQKSNQQYNGWWFNHPGPIERLTGWLVLWTALLFVGTMSSTMVLWRTDNTLRETLDASNRAWVSVVDANLDNEPAEGLPILGSLIPNLGERDSVGLFKSAAG